MKIATPEVYFVLLIGVTGFRTYIGTKRQTIDLGEKQSGVLICVESEIGPRDRDPSGKSPRFARRVSFREQAHSNAGAEPATLEFGAYAQVSRSQMRSPASHLLPLPRSLVSCHLNEFI